MNSSHDPFHTANLCFRKAAYVRWHRHQSKLHILRSQLGFADVPPARPQTCQGCIHYHGIAYGQTRDRRTRLVCGFHPYGWQQSGNCPDWATDTASTAVKITS